MDVVASPSLRHPPNNGQLADGIPVDVTVFRFVTQFAEHVSSSESRGPFVPRLPSVWVEASADGIKAAKSVSAPPPLN